MIINIEEILAYRHKCEWKQLDLKNVEVTSTASLPTTRTIETQGYYQGKMILK